MQLNNAQFLLGTATYVALLISTADLSLSLPHFQCLLFI